MTHTECGIIGLPNVGKSGLFNALTGSQVASCNYPFCTIDPNVGIVPVVDPRLDLLAELNQSQKVLYADMKFIDIAGLVKGAADGAGLGNRFLSHVRDTHALAHVVRCFDHEDITHVSGKVDPEDDIATIHLELVFSDLSSSMNIRSRLDKQAKAKKDLAPTVAVLDKVIQHLEKGDPVRTLSLTEEEKLILKPYSFLTAKPMLYVANIGEDSLDDMYNDYVAVVERIAKKEGAQMVVICVRLEEEVMSLPPEERAGFLATLGIQESGLTKLVKAAYHTLGLISYFTSGPKETRAWTVARGSTAWEAAGAIHTDIQRGFIRAEVMTLEDMQEYGNRVAVKEAGKLRVEGRDYIVEDGDIMLFLHN